MGLTESPENPTGYLPCHMGNNGLHNLDVEEHTFPVPSLHPNLKHKRAKVQNP